MYKSPFEVWYGFQPTFKPPLYLQTRLQSVDEQIKYLEQVQKEVTHQQNVTLLAVTCAFLACRYLASALPFHS